MLALKAYHLSLQLLRIHCDFVHSVVSFQFFTALRSTEIDGPCISSVLLLPSPPCSTHAREKARVRSAPFKRPWGYSLDTLMSPINFPVVEWAIHAAPPLSPTPLLTYARCIASHSFTRLLYFYAECFVLTQMSLCGLAERLDFDFSLFNQWCSKSGTT